MPACASAARIFPPSPRPCLRGWRSLRPAGARLGADAVKALVSYSFRAMRELENILERALALSSGSEIRADDLLLDPADMGRGQSFGSDDAGRNAPRIFSTRVERHAIEEALENRAENRPSQPARWVSPSGPCATGWNAWA